jgi:L-2-hydroxyglutarate oxidase
VQEIEPHVRCLAGIKVPSTGIVNYREVSAKYVELIKSQGGTMQTGTRVDRSREVNGIQVIETPHGEFEAGFIINCAGVFSDRVARFSGLHPGAKIVPFRGDYYELVLESTTYPGTTDEDLRSVLEAGSGMKAGVDFHLAFSPEREDPGK